jgi:hypothetical protein
MYVLLVLDPRDRSSYIKGEWHSDWYDFAMERIDQIVRLRYDSNFACAEIWA